MYKHYFVFYKCILVFLYIYCIFFVAYFLHLFIFYIGMLAILSVKDSLMDVRVSACLTVISDTIKNDYLNEEIHVWTLRLT